MNFLHFGMLPYFLPLVAIPIILHLLTLHRLKTVELSTFRFLFDSYVQQRRRMKFLEALIAFLRTLFLLLLVLAIARPVIRHWSGMFGGSKSGRDVVLLIDGSASMNAVTDGITAFERSKRAALTVVDRLSFEDRVTLIRVGAKPHEICNRFSSDAEAIRNEIQNLKVTPSRGNLFAAFSGVFGPEARKLANPVVYLFTDLQTGGWSEFEEGQVKDLIPAGTELFVVNAGSNKELPNVAVVGDAPDDQRAIAGLPVRLHPRVTNFSESDSRDIPVSIFLDDKEIARRILTVKPGETGEAEVIFTPTQPGIVRGWFEISADRFEGDDQFLFTMNVAPQIQVLLVNGNPAVDPLENEGLYLRTAMIATEAEPGSEAAESPPQIRNSQTRR
ncbi:MAG: VWA domain-containing protein [Planctomycetes bacterium]|nr:VWA domain-containing protein [Planctomycetota bacterium]